MKSTHARVWVMVASFLICLIQYTCNCSLSWAGNLAGHKEALTTIADYADRICREVPQGGYSSSLEASGAVKAELPSLLKKLTDIGIAGTGKWKQEEFQGVLQKDIASLLIASLDCRREVSKRLENLLLIAPQPSVSEKNFQSTSNTSVFLSQSTEASNRPENTPVIPLIRRVGNDVLVHEDVVKKIYKYDPSQPVYLAYGEPDGCGPVGNMWMQNTAIDVKRYLLTKDGQYFIAKGMLNTQFQLVQLEGNKPGYKNVRWTRLEYMAGELGDNYFNGVDCKGGQRTAIWLKQ